MSWPRGTDDNPNQTQEFSHIDEGMVDLDIGKSSHNKQKKLRSNVWENFKKRNEDGKDVAICNLCEKVFDGSSKKGTTHLRNHFKSCQKKRNEGGASGSGDKPARNSVTDQQLNHLDRNHFISCQKKRNEGAASGSGDKPAGNSVTDQQLNHLDRVKTLIKQCYWDFPHPLGDIDIINVYNEEKKKVRTYFENLSCCFSLTIRDLRDGKYAGFTVHFIDDDWNLEEKIIGFKCIERAQNMEVLKNVLSDLGIDHNNISSMVTDGDSDIYVLSSDERENMFRVQGSPLSNCKFCVHDFSCIEMTCPDLFDEMGYALYDHIHKIFNYITETPSKIETFQIAARSLGKEVTAEDIQEKVKYKSGSDLLKIALGLKEAFFELENIYLDFEPINLTKEQWDVITKFDQFCHEEADSDEICGICWITANMNFPRLCRMFKKTLVFVPCWNSFNCGESYPELVRVAKCWDKYNLILAVAAVLDPRFKMDTVEHWYKKIYGDECGTKFAEFRNHFTGVYNEYANGTNQSSTSGSKEKKSSISYQMLDISGNSSRDPESGQLHNVELDLYLKHVNFPRMEEFDILEWWRVNSRYFPTLAKMARDFLSIQIIVPPVEDWYFDCLFSHKDFNSDIVKDAFVCTESWLTNEEDE